MCLRYVRSEQEPLWSCAQSPPPHPNPPAASTGACLPFRYGSSQSADVSPQAARVTSAHVLPAFLTMRLNNEGSVSQGGQAGQEGAGGGDKTRQSSSHLPAKKFQKNSQKETRTQVKNQKKMQKVTAASVGSGKIRHQRLKASVSISAAG